MSHFIAIGGDWVEAQSFIALGGDWVAANRIPMGEQHFLFQLFDEAGDAQLLSFQNPLGIDIALFGVDVQVVTPGKAT